MMRKTSVLVAAFISVLLSMTAVHAVNTNVDGLPGGTFENTFNIEINKPAHNRYYIYSGGHVDPAAPPAETMGAFIIPLGVNDPLRGTEPALNFGVWFQASAPGTFMIFFASEDDLGASSGNVNPYMLNLDTDRVYGLNYDIDGRRYDLNADANGYDEVAGAEAFSVATDTVGGDSSSAIGPKGGNEALVTFGYPAGVADSPTVSTGAVFLDSIKVEPGNISEGYYDFNIRIPFPLDENGARTFFRSGFYRGYVVVHFKPVE